MQIPRPRQSRRHPGLSEKRACLLKNVAQTIDERLILVAVSRFAQDFTPLRSKSESRTAQAGAPRGFFNTQERFCNWLAVEVAGDEGRKAGPITGDHLRIFTWLPLMLLSADLHDQLHRGAASPMLRLPQTVIHPARRWS